MKGRILAYFKESIPVFEWGNGTSTRKFLVRIADPRENIPIRDVSDKKQDRDNAVLGPIIPAKVNSTLNRVSKGNIISAEVITSLNPVSKRSIIPSESLPVLILCLREALYLPKSVPNLILFLREALSLP